MDEKLKQIAAEAFGLEPDVVTEDHIKVIEGIAAKTKPTPTPTPPALDLGATKIKELEEKLLESERALAQTKAPPLDPDEAEHNIAEHNKRMDRLSRVKRLPDINKLMLMDVRGDQDLADAQQAWDDLYTLSVVRGSVNRPMPFRRLNYWNELDTRAPHLHDAIEKAIATANTGEGSEWAPDRYSSQVIEAVFDDLFIANLFERFPQPADTYKPMVGLTGGTAYLAGESTLDDPAEYQATTPTTDDLTFTAKKIAVRFNYSEEADEDSIVPLLPRLQARAGEVLGEAIEEAIIGGDITATHMDSNVTSSIDRRRAWDGLRHQAAVTLTTAFNDLSTFSGDTVGGILTDMTQKYFRPLNNVVYIFPSASRIALLNLTDNSTNNNPIFIRSTQLGDATVLNGQVGDLFGHPVFLSGWLPVNLNASGVYDGTTTTKKCAITVARSAWRIGDRRNVTMEVVREPLKGRNCLLVTWRGSFTHVYPATDVTTGGGYNF